MNQEFLCWENHVVVKVIFDSFDIQNAFLVANNKTAFINAHNPGGILRPVNVIHSRIVAGKLADAAVKQMLQSAISSNLQTPWPVVTEYDENRADNFQFPDPFDLQITNVSTGHRETVEVRSSFAYRLAPESKIISKLSTYGWYTSASKNIEEPRDWYWQVVYYSQNMFIQIWMQQLFLKKSILNFIM